MRKTDLQAPISLLLIWLMGLLFMLTSCATQNRSASTFGSRLTETQNFWRTGMPYGKAPRTSCAAASAALYSGGQTQQILDRLVYVSPLRGYPVKALVSNNSSLNAGTDGLTIVVNSGLLQMFGNREDVIATVLAHELGHVIAHHQPSKNSSLSLLQYASPFWSFVPYGGYAGTALGETMKIQQATYSRVQENEADAIGSILAVRAGYSPHGLGDFLEMASKTGCGSRASVPIPTSIPTSVSAIPESVALPLLRTSPLYKSHPPTQSRTKIVDLVAKRHSGQITQEQLKAEVPWLASIYETLERRTPKG